MTASSSRPQTWATQTGAADSQSRAFRSGQLVSGGIDVQDLQLGINDADRQRQRIQRRSQDRNGGGRRHGGRLRRLAVFVELEH